MAEIVVEAQSPVLSRRRASRRRRVFDAGLLLSIIAFIAWWYWPREDSRFTGSWRDPRLGGIWTLRSNGIATWQGFKGAEISHGWTHWHTDGKVLWIGPPAAREATSLPSRLNLLVGRIIGAPYLTSGPTYQIDSITAEALWMLAPSAADRGLTIRFRFDRYSK